MFGIASTGTAQTDTPTANAAPDSGDIVVTARRRAEDIAKVPVAITAFGALQLEERNIDRTEDLVKLTPGLNIANAGSFTPGVTIRGQSRVASGPGTPGVLIYLNDVPLPNTGSLISTFDMDNIQVLKGPQGTLFGRNAIGGAILTYTKKPTYDLGGYIQAEYGSYNARKLELALNVPIIQDVLAVRVAAQIGAADGFVKTVQYAQYAQAPNGVITAPTLVGTSRNGYNKNKNRAIRASVLFEPTYWLRNTMVVDAVRIDNAANGVLDGIFPNGFPATGSSPAVPAQAFLFTPSAFLLPTLTFITGSPASAQIAAANLEKLYRCTTSPACNLRDFAALQASSPRHTAYTNIEPRSVNRLFGISNTTSIEFGDSLTLKNIFSFRTSKSYQRGDTDATPLPILASSLVTNLRQTTDELQLSGGLMEDRLKFVAGGLYYNSRPNGPGGLGALNNNSFGGLSNSTSVNFLIETSKALYAQADFDIVRGLTFTAGYRYSWDKSEGCIANITYAFNAQGLGGKQDGIPGDVPTYDQCRTKTIPAYIGSVSRTTFVPAPGKFEKGTYTFALNWQATDDTLLYATTRRGYRAGGFNSQVLFVNYPTLQYFQPEVLTDYEVGLKTRFRVGGIHGNLSGAVFRGKDKGYQSFESTSGRPNLTAAGLLTNKADLSNKGFEGALVVIPVEGLTLSGSVAYTDIKIDRYTINADLARAFGGAGNVPRTVVANQPKWQYNAGVNYRFPGDIAGGTLSINADYHRQTAAPSGDTFIPAYQTVDARIGLANIGGKPVDISVFAKNLFNEYYRDGMLLTTKALSLFSSSVAPPRTIGLVARFRFGGES